jgi:hypothetical protein
MSHIEAFPLLISAASLMSMVQEVDAPLEKFSVLLVHYS